MDRAALALLLLLWGSRKAAATPAAASTGNVHRDARRTLRAAFELEWLRQPRLPEAQFLQGWGWVESRYGAAFKGPMAGSHNWGSVMCHGAPSCAPATDSYSDGTTFEGSFRRYKDDLEGARDMIREATKARPRSGQALFEEGTTIFRVALALRREHYYGELCPVATAAAKASGQAKPNAAACEREATTRRAQKVAAAVQEIAAANGEAVAIPLGTFDDAVWWWSGQPQKPPQGVVPGPPVGPTMGGDVTDEMVSWSWQVLQGGAPVGTVVGPRSFTGKDGAPVAVLARVEWHPPDPPAGPPRWHRGVGLYHTP